MLDTFGNPVYVTSIEEVLWGCLLIGITMVIHGLAMILTLRITHAFRIRIQRSPSIALASCVVILSSWTIIVAHLSEVMVWANFFLWKGAMPSLSAAYYLALMDYTTVGSEFNLPLRWRLLEGLIAASGFLTFAWSTGVFLSVAQLFQGSLATAQTTPGATHTPK